MLEIPEDGVLDLGKARKEAKIRQCALYCLGNNSVSGRMFQNGQEKILFN